MCKSSLSVCACILICARAGAVRADATVVSDGFESYNQGILDKNQPGTANPASNGSGQPWWGPGTVPNFYVVGAENGVTPHAGTQMIRGDDATAGQHSLAWQNVAYRYNAGQPFSGDLRYDFWFYDPNGSTNGGNYQENSALAFYSDNPSNADYPTTTDTLSNSALVERLTLGAANFKSHSTGAPQLYDPTLYQARVVGQSGGYNANGWFNVPLTRSVGWHHGLITVGPRLADGSNGVSFYIDNFSTPLLTTTTTINQGYSDLEFTAEGSAVGYFDDATLVETPEPVSALAIGFFLAAVAWPAAARRRKSRARAVAG